MQFVAAKGVDLPALTGNGMPQPAFDASQVEPQAIDGDNLVAGGQTGELRGAALDNALDGELPMVIL